MRENDNKQGGTLAVLKASRRPFLAVKQKHPDAGRGTSAQAWEFDALFRKLESFEAGVARLKKDLQRISEKLEKLSSKKIKFDVRMKKTEKLVKNIWRNKP